MSRLFFLRLLRDGGLRLLRDGGLRLLRDGGLRLLRDGGLRSIVPALAVLSLLLSAGCASKTRIYTIPAGADLILDEKKALGQSPVEYKETVWIWTKHKVTARLADHDVKSITIKNNGMNGAGFAACACTVGLLLPFMFVSEYQPQYLIELSPIDDQNSKREVTEPVATRGITFRP